jgi:hypothetical protein
MSTCAKCIWWKRRWREHGICWQRAEYYPDPRANTREDDTCQHFEAKVLQNRPVRLQNDETTPSST